jgi:hypothetical protein
MKLRPNPEKIKGQLFQSIRSYVFVAWFPDLSVAIRICILACLYNLKANRNQFGKYFEVYMILKDDCTERPLLVIEMWSAEVETCNMRLFHPLLGYQFSMGNVTRSDQGFSSTRGMSLGTRLEQLHENTNKSTKFFFNKRTKWKYEQKHHILL